MTAQYTTKIFIAVLRNQWDCMLKYI